jgi:hypothetical protein
MYNVKFKDESWVQKFRTEPVDLKPTVGVRIAFLFTALGMSALPPHIYPSRK